MTDLSEMKKMDNRIDIAKFIIHDKMSSKINHILNKKKLKCSESENFDEDDLDERNLSRKNHTVRTWVYTGFYLNEKDNKIL